MKTDCELSGYHRIAQAINKALGFNLLPTGRYAGLILLGAIASLVALQLYLNHDLDRRRAAWNAELRSAEASVQAAEEAAREAYNDRMTQERMLLQGEIEASKRAQEMALEAEIRAAEAGAGGG